jgi:hypothetical protein
VLARQDVTLPTLQRGEPQKEQLLRVERPAAEDEVLKALLLPTELPVARPFELPGPPGE